MNKDIIKQMEPTDAALRSLAEALYAGIIAAIIQLVRPFMERFPDGIPCSLLYRYIDEDLEQSIYRIKKVKVEEGRLLVLIDSNNGGLRPEEMTAEYDEDFCDENTDELTGQPRSDMFSIDYAKTIYDYLLHYGIPRLIEKYGDEDSGQ